MYKIIDRPIALLFSAFFILAHQPSGKPVYINAEQIDFIGPADPYWDGSGAGSRLMVYGIWVAVKEKPDEVKSAIDKALKQE